MKSKLAHSYHQMIKFFGPQHWWPGDSPLEVTIGAILTQNTAWSNVEKAIINLKREKLLGNFGESHYLKKWQKISAARLGILIRPAGYFNQKSRRLKIFVNWLMQNYGSLEVFFKLPLQLARPALLAVNGIGPETADSILLYAGNKKTFVVDAYTKRILSRHLIIPERASYDELQNLLTKYLPKKTPLYNEYHALIVQVGKNFCKKSRPFCTVCPLNGWNWNKKISSYLP